MDPKLQGKLSQSVQPSVISNDGSKVARPSVTTIQEKPNELSPDQVNLQGFDALNPTPVWQPEQNDKVGETKEIGPQELEKIFKNGKPEEKTKALAGLAQGFQQFTKDPNTKPEQIFNALNQMNTIVRESK